MKIACIVLASGKSHRFKKSKSKLFYKVYGAPVIEYTLKNILKYTKKNSLYITIPKNLNKKEKKILSNFTEKKLILGGKNRSESLKNAIINIEKDKYDYLVVHDGARPITPKSLLNDVFFNIKLNKFDCILPTSQVEDTLRKKNKTLNRNNYYLYQTPQAFRFNIFFEAIKNSNKVVNDDFGFLENKKNLKIKYIDSKKGNIKITRSDDIDIFKKLISHTIKYANGFDIHKLENGNYLSLAGLKIKSKYKAVGHSDGDVVLHSIIDALLGANSQGDIGLYFPALKKYKNISSVILLNKIKNIIKLNRIIIINLDCTIICQKIRLEI